MNDRFYFSIPFTAPLKFFEGYWFGGLSIPQAICVMIFNKILYELIGIEPLVKIYILLTFLYVEYVLEKIFKG
jgi:hypothetical protein